MGDAWPRPWAAAPAATLVEDAARDNAAAAALALYAQVLDAGSLRAAASALVHGLAAAHGFDRVTLGWHERGVTRLLASSQGGLDEQGDRKRVV